MVLVVKHQLFALILYTNHCCFRVFIVKFGQKWSIILCTLGYMTWMAANAFAGELRLLILLLLTSSSSSSSSSSPLPHPPPILLLLHLLSSISPYPPPSPPILLPHLSSSSSPHPPVYTHQPIFAIIVTLQPGTR
jgi:hypothetical protein